MDAFATLKK
jgi:hypothetical protein